MISEFFCHVCTFFLKVVKIFINLDLKLAEILQRTEPIPILPIFFIIWKILILYFKCKLLYMGSTSEFYVYNYDKTDYSEKDVY